MLLVHILVSILHFSIICKYISSHLELKFFGMQLLIRLDCFLH